MFKASSIAAVLLFATFTSAWQGANAGSGTITQPEITSSKFSFYPGSTNSGSVSFTWVPPVLATNGIAGYNIYRGGRYYDTVDASQRRYIAEVVTAPEEFFLTAFDSAGNYSDASNRIRSPEDGVFSADNVANPTPPWIRWKSRSGGGRILSWSDTPSRDSNGIGGYNVHKNGTYYRSVYTESFDDPNGFESGSCYQVFAWDEGKPTRYSNLSNEVCY